MSKSRKCKYTVLLAQKTSVNRGYGLIDRHTVSAANKNEAIKKAINKDINTYKNIYKCVHVDSNDLIAVKCSRAKKEDYRHKKSFWANLQSSKTLKVIKVDGSF